MCDNMLKSLGALCLWHLELPAFFDFVENFTATITVVTLYKKKHLWWNKDQNNKLDVMNQA